MKIFMINTRYAEKEKDMQKICSALVLILMYKKNTKKGLDKEKMLKNQLFCHMTVNTICSGG